MLSPVDDAGQLDAQQKAIKWLDDHWPEDRRKCPIDQNTDWNITDIVQFNRFTPGSVLRGEVYPAIQVICTTCGYTLLFSAVLAGIVKRHISAETRATNESSDAKAAPGTS